MSRCSHDGYSELQSRKVFQCCDCRIQTSAPRGTLFARAKLPLAVWLLEIYLVTQAKDGISSLNLARTFGISDNAPCGCNISSRRL